MVDLREYIFSAINAYHFNSHPMNALPLYTDVIFHRRLRPRTIKAGKTIRRLFSFDDLACHSKIETLGVMDLCHLGGWWCIPIKIEAREASLRVGWRHKEGDLLV